MLRRHLVERPAVAQQELRGEVVPHYAPFGTVGNVGVDGVNAREGARQRVGLPSVVKRLGVDGIADGTLHIVPGWIEEMKARLAAAK